MPHDRARAPRPAWQRLGFLALLLLVVGASATIARAQVEDPVEDLAGSLNIKLDDLANPTETVLNFRRDTLQKKVERLRTLGQLRRALGLEDWKLQLPVDVQMRKLVADRFLRGLDLIIHKGDPTARMAAANLIAEMGPSIRGIEAGEPGEFSRAVLKGIIELSKDDSVEVRQEALRALGNVNPPPAEAYAVFHKALERDTLGARRQAAAGLGQMVRVINFLSKQNKPNAGVAASRTELIEVCRAAAAGASFGLADADAQVRQLCITAVDESARAIWYLIAEPYPKRDFPPDGRQLSDEERKDIQEKQDFVRGEVRSVEAVLKTYQSLIPLLARNLEAKEFPVRDEAARALEDIATARLRVIRRTLSVPSFTKEQQSERYEGLKKFDPFDYFFQDDRLAQLGALLQSPEARLRRRAADTLELLGEDAQSQLPALAQALCDPDRFVRWAAARAIGHVGPRHAAAYAVPNLAKLLSDNDDNVRLAASVTLEAMGPLAREALPALIKAIASGDTETRTAAMFVLLSLGEENARDAVPTLIEALSATDARIRRNAAEVLGKLASVSTQAVAPLRRALEDDDQEVRINASEALLNILGPRVP